MPISVLPAGRNRSGTSCSQLAPWQCRDTSSPGLHQPKPHYFYTNYQLSNSVIQLRSKVEPYVYPAREDVPRSFSHVRSEYQEKMEDGLKPRFSSVKSQSVPRQHKSGKKLFNGIPPSVEYKLKKRRNLLESAGKTVGPDQRWQWDKQTRPQPVSHSSSSNADSEQFTKTHPNSMDSIINNWRNRFNESRGYDTVQYRKKNVYSRQTFIDGTAEMNSIMHEYPYESSGFTPNTSNEDYKPL